MNVDIAGKMLPATGASASADFWLTETNADGATAIVVGDVTGHGDAAAGQAAKVRQTFVAAAGASTGPDELLELANRRWIEQGHTGLYVTAAAVTYDPAERRLTWAYSGHPAPCWLDSGQPLNGVRPGLPLGVQWQLGCTANSRADVPPDAGLLLYTDGLENAVGAGRNRFGIERVMHLLTQMRGFSPEQIVDRLTESMIEYAGGELDDDVLAVALRLR